MRHTRKNVIASQCAHWRGNPLLQDTAPQTRNNGRTRGSLPIENPAPRPCSASLTVPTHTFLGSLTGCRSVLFSSLLLSIISAIISRKSKVCQHPIVRINYRFAAQPQALPFGEGAPVGGGRGAVQCFVFPFHAAKTHCGNTSSVTAAPCHLPQRGRLSFVRKQQFTHPSWSATWPPPRRLRLPPASRRS